MDRRLFSLLRAFFALTPPKQLTFPSELNPSHISDFFVQHILLNPHFQSYSPSSQYQQQFWKWAISNLEEASRKYEWEECNEDFEVDSRIYEHYVSLIPAPGPTIGGSDPDTRLQLCGRGVPLQNLSAPPTQSYSTQYWTPITPVCGTISDPPYVNPRTYQTTTLLESRTVIESGTTGLRTWLAGLILSQYLIGHPELVASKTVLELGSGIGFLGIISASLQYLSSTLGPGKSPGSLWLSDVKEEVLIRCRNNLNLPCNLSSSCINVRCIFLDWNDALDPIQCGVMERLMNETIKPETILGADVIFDPSLIPSLVATLRLSLRAHDTEKGRRVALIALTIRNDATVEKFLTHVREQNLTISSIELGFQGSMFSNSEIVEGMDASKNVKLFQITLS